MFRRALIFLAAASFFILGIGILGVLNNIPNAKEKSALAKIRLKEKTLSQSFDVLVVRSGFQKKSTGTRDIYVPCLLVQATNSSAMTSKPANLRAGFLRNGRAFCMAQGMVPALKPGETWEIWLKCIDFVGFGSVAWGLTLAETTEGMDFEVYLESSGVSIVVTKDKLRSMLS
jgi:hypothetical protein